MQVLLLHLAARVVNIAACDCQLSNILRGVCIRKLCHSLATLDILRQDVVPFGAVPRQLIVKVSLENVRSVLN